MDKLSVVLTVIPIVIDAGCKLWKALHKENIGVKKMEDIATEVVEAYFKKH